MNTLPQALDEYLALRQAMGFQVRDARSLLRRFIAFLEQQEATYITHELVCTGPPNPARSSPRSGLGA